MLDTDWMAERIALALNGITYEGPNDYYPFVRVNAIHGITSRGSQVAVLAGVDGAKRAQQFKVLVEAVPHE